MRPRRNERLIINGNRWLVKKKSYKTQRWDPVEMGDYNKYYPLTIPGLKTSWSRAMRSWKPSATLKPIATTTPVVLESTWTLSSTTRRIPWVVSSLTTCWRSREWCSSSRASGTSTVSTRWVGEWDDQVNYSCVALGTWLFTKWVSVTRARWR